MKITHIKKLIFSPTGGTEKVVDVVSKVWKQPQETIDLSDSHLDFSQYIFTGHDLCIIAVPSFGGRVPAIVVERLKTIQAMKAPTLLIVTYGNRAYDDTLLELKHTAKQQGFTCISAIAAVCEHSIMRQFGRGRPDKLDEMQLTDYAENIHDIIERVTEMVEVNVPGDEPYRDYSGVPMKPKASKKCTQCGLCASKCPVNAIDRDNPRQTDDKICISCMRCISICPQQARKCNPVIMAVGVKKMSKTCTGSKTNELFLIQKDEKRT